MDGPMKAAYSLLCGWFDSQVHAQVPTSTLCPLLSFLRPISLAGRS